MIVYEGPGDLLHTDIPTITCPVNIVGAMGAGLALAMRKRIPGLYPYYQQLCRDRTLRIGRCAVYPIPNRQQQVLLLPTKAHWRDPSELHYVEQALEFMLEHQATLNIEELALPPLGCGLGQLDYPRDVGPLIKRLLGSVEDLNVHILFGP